MCARAHIYTYICNGFVVQRYLLRIGFSSLFVIFSLFLALSLFRGTLNFRVKKRIYVSPLSFAEVDTHAPQALSHPGVSACDCKRGTERAKGVEGKGLYGEIGFGLCSCQPAEMLAYGLRWKDQSG